MLVDRRSRCGRKRLNVLSVFYIYRCQRSLYFQICVSDFEIQLGYSQIHFSLNSIEIRNDLVQLVLIEEVLYQLV